MGSVDIPVIELAEVPMQIGDGPDGLKILVIGPLMLAIPFADDTREWLDEEMHGRKVKVMPASALNALPKT